MLFGVSVFVVFTLSIRMDTANDDDIFKAQLRTACIYGNAKKISKLLNSNPGFDINISLNTYGRVLLHYAASYRSMDCLRIILEHGGVDLNIQNERGFTALHFAAFWGRFEAVKALIEAGADCSIRDNKGQTALELALDIETRKSFVVGTNYENQL